MAITNKLSHSIKYLKLSIQVSLNGLSFCILDAKCNTITDILHKPLDSYTTPSHLLNTITTLFETEHVLQQPFDYVQAIHVTPSVTLIPKSFFDANAKVEYLKFNTEIESSTYIAHDDITINNSVVVYTPYVTINNFIFDTFGTYNYKHHATVLITSILNNEKTLTTTKCYVHIAHNSVDIVVVNQKGLILYNTFDYLNPEDYISHLLFTLEQLQLHPETLPLILLGHVKQDDPLYAITYRYIKHVTFGTSSHHFNFESPQTQQHDHFTLIHSLCE